MPGRSKFRAMWWVGLGDPSTDAWHGRQAIELIVSRRKDPHHGNADLLPRQVCLRLDCLDPEDLGNREAAAGRPCRDHAEDRGGQCPGQTS